MAKNSTPLITPVYDPRYNKNSQMLGRYALNITPEALATSRTNTNNLVDVEPTYPSLKDVLNTSSSSSSGYGARKQDISGILAAYEQSAATKRKDAETKYNTARNDLLTSLKRFQENNARDVENTQRAYLTEQAALDEARAEANRANRISMSARGLAGSGLQQLAQLQNLLGQSQDISNLATENQINMDALRRSLAENEEDTNKNLTNLLNEYNNALDSITSELAMNKAEAEAQAEAAYTSALNSRSSSSSSNEYNTLMGVLNDALGDAQSKARTNKTGKITKSQYNTIISQLESSLPYGVNVRSTKEFQDTLNKITDLRK